MNSRKIFLREDLFSWMPSVQFLKPPGIDCILSMPGGFSLKENVDSGSGIVFSEPAGFIWMDQSNMDSCSKEAGSSCIYPKHASGVYSMSCSLQKSVKHSMSCALFGLGRTYAFP